MQVSKQSTPGATRSDHLRSPRRSAQPNSASKPMDRACPAAQAESRCVIRRLSKKQSRSRGSVASKQPKTSFHEGGPDAKPTDVELDCQCSGDALRSDNSKGLGAGPRGADRHRKLRG